MGVNPEGQLVIAPESRRICAFKSFEIGGVVKILYRKGSDYAIEIRFRHWLDFGAILFYKNIYPQMLRDPSSLQFRFSEAIKSVYFLQVLPKDRFKAIADRNGDSVLEGQGIVGQVVVIIAAQAGIHYE
jgi:hypothetical protein